MYLVYYPDGTMMVLVLGKYKDHMPGTLIYLVDSDLTVADISEINAGNGWALGSFPPRLENKINKMPNN